MEDVKNQITFFLINIEKNVFINNILTVTLHVLYNISDSEQREEANGFTMVFSFYPVNKISTKRSSLIWTYNTLSFRELDQDGTLLSQQLLNLSREKLPKKLQKTTKIEF